MHLYCDVTSLCKFGALKSYLFLVLSRVPLNHFYNAENFDALKTLRINRSLNFLSQIGFFATFIPKCESVISIFVNDRVPDDSCKPALKFLVRNGCVKDKKIKELDACDKVEIWIFQMMFLKFF